MYLDKVYYNEKGKPSEIDIICDKCGTTIEITDMEVFSYLTSDICFLKNDKEITCVCGNIHNTEIITFRHLQELKECIVNKTDNQDTQVKCPKCGSTNIQIVPRKWSLLTGFLTNKTDRVCVNCKHKF